MDFIYVPGHQDKNIPRHLLTQEQKLNINMDTLAKWTLRRAFRNSRFIDSNFPWEPLQFRKQGNKVLRSPTKAIQEAFSRQTARLFYNSRNIGLKRVMASWPLTVRAGYSKILAKFIGVNHFLQKDLSRKDRCQIPVLFASRRDH